MFRTREAWLKAALAAITAPAAERADIEIPADTLVSVGFPSGGGRKCRTIGQCHYATHEDGARRLNHIFVHPKLCDPREVLQVLVHEAIHAALPVGTGHRGAFVTAMNRLDLGGLPTATVRTPEFDEWTAPILGELGRYPHTKLDPPKRKKQSTRMLKYLCPSCGFIARASRKWREMYTRNPVCPCGTEWIEE